MKKYIIGIIILFLFVFGGFLSIIFFSETEYRCYWILENQYEKEQINIYLKLTKYPFNNIFWHNDSWWSAWFELPSWWTRYYRYIKKNTRDQLNIYYAENDEFMWIFSLLSNNISINLAFWWFEWKCDKIN